MVRVLTVHQLVRGSGLAPDAVIRDLRCHTGAILADCLLQHATHLTRGLFRHDLFAIRQRVTPEQRHRQQPAAVSQNRIGARELQRRDRDAVAVAECRDFDRYARGRIHAPGDLARQTDTGDRTEASLGEHLTQAAAAERERDARRADVARLLDHLCNRERTVVVRIADGIASDAEQPGRRVDHGVREELAAFKRGRGRERLERRTRLEHVGHGAVAKHRTAQARTVVRIETRLVDHRQHLAAARVQHNGAGTTRVVRGDRRLEFAVDEILETPVKTQRDVLARHRQCHALNALDNVAVAVLEHALAPGDGAQLLVVGELNTFQALIVHIGEADHMPGDCSRWVVTAILACQPDAGNIEHLHLLGLLGRHVSLEIHELTALVMAHRLGDFALWDTQNLGERRPLCVRLAEFTRLGPYRIDRCADGQRLAMPIEDHAAMRVVLDHAQVAGITLLLQIVRRDHLQPQGARREQRHAAKQKAKHHGGA